VVPWTLGAMVRVGQNVGDRLEEATREFVNGEGRIVRDDVASAIELAVTEVTQDPPFIVYISGDYTNPQAPAFNVTVQNLSQEDVGE